MSRPNDDPFPSTYAVPASRPFAIRNVTLMTAAGPTIASGTIVVRDGKIVGEGVSAVVTDRDPTAHAEMQAIRDAARRLRTNDLSGCEMYGTSRACPMCEAAAYWARLRRMHSGEPPADDGAPRLR